MKAHILHRLLYLATPPSAVFLLCIGVSGCEKPAEHSIISQAAEQREVQLPDNSKATLNARSTLSFSTSTWKEKPQVTLEGEAFFITKKNARFFVKTHQGNLELISAQANVYARDQTLEVMCTVGRVQVSNSMGTERVLLASKEQVSIENGQMQRRLGLQYFPAWMRGESIFRNAPLARVFDEIGRQFGKTVLAQHVEGTFSGRFSNKDLEQSLSTVCKKARLQYKILGDTVKVSP